MITYNDWRQRYQDVHYVPNDALDIALPRPEKTIGSKRRYHSSKEPTLDFR